MLQRRGLVLARVKGSSPGPGNKELRAWQFQGQTRRGPMELARQLLPILPASPVGGETTHERRGVLKFSKSLAGKERHRRGQALRRDQAVGVLPNPQLCIASSPVARCGHPVPTWLLTHTRGNDVSFVPGDNQCLRIQQACRPGGALEGVKAPWPARLDPRQPHPLTGPRPGFSLHPEFALLKGRTWASPFRGPSSC